MQTKQDKQTVFGIDIYPERDNSFSEAGMQLLQKFYSSEKG